MTLPNAKAALPSLLVALRAEGATEVTVTFYGGGDEGSIDDISGTSHHDEVETYAYALLEEVGVDWYNNDGGNGEITINVVTGAVVYTVNQNETVSREAASGSFI